MNKRWWQKYELFEQPKSPPRPPKPRIDILTINQLVELLGLPDLDKSVNDSYSLGEYVYMPAYNEAINEGLSEEEAERKGYEAEEAWTSAYYKCVISAIEEVADEVFGWHKLELTPSKRLPRRYKITPKTLWMDAAKEIIHTINGVGMFHVDGLREFLDVGPYRSSREAVCKHLGNMASRAEVYGNPSPTRMYERALESCVNHI